MKIIIESSSKSKNKLFNWVHLRTDVSGSEGVLINLGSFLFLTLESKNFNSISLYFVIVLSFESLLISSDSIPLFIRYESWFIILCAIWLFSWFIFYKSRWRFYSKWISCKVFNSYGFRTFYFCIRDNKLLFYSWIKKSFYLDFCWFDLSRDLFKNVM